MRSWCLPRTAERSTPKPRPRIGASTTRHPGRSQSLLTRTRSWPSNRGTTRTRHWATTTDTGTRCSMIGNCFAYRFLAERVRKIPDSTIRELFTCLFSGLLEFNNMFASYKGEGTGAVRHMFAHHVLKPERVPLEANVWGTPKSSGSFMTMFRGRIARALEYAQDPFELTTRSEGNRRKTEKVYGLSEPLRFDIATDLRGFNEGRQVYLSWGDSARTELRSGSIDAVVTDPPFFDNVHYSQLADFFHVWQQHVLGSAAQGCAPTTRTDAEVQHADVATFTEAARRRMGGDAPGSGGRRYPRLHLPPFAQRRLAVGPACAYAGRICDNGRASDKGRAVRGHAETAGSGTHRSGHDPRLPQAVPRCRSWSGSTITGGLSTRRRLRRCSGLDPGAGA